MSEDDLPDDSGQLLAAFRLTRPVALQWLVASTAGFVLALYLFGTALEAVHGGSLEPVVVSVGSPPHLLGWIVAVAVVVVAVVVPHELVHGLFMARYGARPEYGVGVSHLVPYAYARTEGASYTRNQMLVVLLSPLVALSLVGLGLLAVVPSPLVVLALAANAAGSVGDLWMAALLCRYPPEVRVGELPDGADGIGVYGAPGAGERRVDSPALLAFGTGAVTTLVAILAGLFVLVAGSLAFASGTVVLGDPDGRWFLFRHELVADGRGALLEVGFPLLLALSAAGGAVWAVLATAARRLA
ncbi:DUF3267 domain-containing protein [Natrononativus amylolyticus]|uniref:DUF3267 domain-containing protein n=1 Tax=Natrononativus amylolyticus TaxID=2963434 RepID=UPI0020CFC6DA|nr:DUF3267 domain-containing protein [Natrononativus amylolyticus]